MFSKAFVRFNSATSQENNSTIKKVTEHTAPALLRLRDSGGIGSGENALKLIQCHVIENSDQKNSHFIFHFLGCNDL